MDTKEALEKYKVMLQERGLHEEANAAEKHLEELKLQEKVKQFYCRHEYVRTCTRKFFIKYNVKICKKCGHTL
jgi:hypothetical protein